MPPPAETELAAPPRAATRMVELPPAPYIGLRAFRPTEAVIFCGRAQQRAELLDILAEDRFLAVVGASGSGKSSLVFAGLLPDIRDGQLAGVDPGAARIACLHPELRPFAHLAEALAPILPSGADIESALRRGPLGLSQLLDETEYPPGQALIIVVDQFEEIFRFADLSSADLEREEFAHAVRPMLDGPQNEAQAFVNLLLASAQEARRLVYVLVTMRSDFLARCDQFAGLPEAISHSQFLTPRLNRFQLEQAITRPARLFGATVQPELVNLILNQISNAQDQLPLMEHALARTWEQKKRAQPEGSIRLEVSDYLAVGGLASALDWHGNSLCETLEKTKGIPRESVERFFRCLAVTVSPNIPPVRRPASVAQIAEETGLPTDTVRAIADAFRAEGNNLLRPPVTEVAHLEDDRFVDIVHESLLRQWQWLTEWTRAEWRQRRVFEELAQAMGVWLEQNAADSKHPLAGLRRWQRAGEVVSTRLYREALPFLEPEAEAARAAIPRQAKRYGLDWNGLAGFWKQVRLWKQMAAVASTAGAGLVVLSLLLVVAVVGVAALWERTRLSERDAKKSEANAHLEMTVAKQARDEAEKARQDEQQARRAAEASQRSAVLEGVRTSADLLIVNENLKTLVEAVTKSGRDASALDALIKKPEYQSLLAPKPVAVGATTGERVVAGAAAPVEFSLDGIGAHSTPRVAFAWGPDKALLVAAVTPSGTSAGAGWSYWSGWWNLSQAAPAAVDLQLESRSLVGSQDDVLLIEGGRIRRVTGGGAIFISADCRQTITTAKLVGDSPRVVLVGTSMGQLGLWDGQHDTRVDLYDVKLGEVSSVDYVTKGPRTVLAADTSGVTKWWTLLPGGALFDAMQVPMGTHEHHGSPGPRCAILSPDARWVAISASVGPPLLIDAQTAEITTSSSKGAPSEATGTGIKPATLPMSFSNDSSMLACDGGDGAVHLLDAIHRGPQWPRKMTATMKLEAVLSGHHGPLTALRWSPKGDYLLSAGTDGSTILWQQPLARLQITYNEQPYLLPAHKGGVTDAAISPDGRFVATTGMDGVARVYPLRPTLRGTFREWGGPKGRPPLDKEMALLDLSDLKSPQFSKYFLPEQPAGTTGLVARLNPEAFYVNARWNYSFTRRSTLRNTRVLLRKLDHAGKPTGDTIEAQPVDWGPGEESHYAFDLSPGAARALKLAPTDSVEMEIPLLDLTSEDDNYK